MLVNKIINKITSCENCDLYHNGRAKPYLGKKAKYIIIAEAPGFDEVKQNTPLIGKTGKLLFNWLASVGFNRDDFLILNSCNCRPIIEKNGIIKNGKPTKIQIKSCYKQNIALIYNFNVEKEINIITLGDYAKYMFSHTLGDMTKMVGIKMKLNIKNKIFNVTFNYHPSYAFIYSKKELNKFKEIFTGFLKVK